MTLKKLLFYFVAMGLFSAAQADAAEDAAEAEHERQEAFRFGMEYIVEDLDLGLFDAFIDAIDQRDMVERIFGLRLIDGGTKRSFTENLEWTWDDLIISGFEGSEEEFNATLLSVASRGDRGRAVVRYDLPDFKFAYHEYDLRLDRRGEIVVVDWIDFLRGSTFSESVGRQLVMVAASQPAMRKLVDNRQINTREMFQFGELLKAARDRQLDRYLDIRDGMSERMQNQRIVIELSVQVARAARKRRQMIAALEIMAEHYPNEPLYSLMLLDYYFPSRKYDEAFQALQRLSDRLGGEDAAMDARFSAAALVMGNLQDAKKYADAALQREPGLELGWWSALNVRAAMDDFSACVEALQHLESEFDYDLGPEKLKKNKTYAQLVQSDEYKSWVESRQ